jgi:hypothetical protein
MFLRQLPCFFQFCKSVESSWHIFFNKFYLDLGANPGEQFVQCPAHDIVFPRVVREFCDWEHRGPGPRETAGLGSKVLFDPGIHSFRLTICPRVKCARKVLLNPQILAHRAGELRRKSRVLVGDDATGESEEGEDVFHVQARGLCSVDHLETGDESCSF